MMSVGFGIASILPLGRVQMAAVGLTAQVVDTMAWTFEDRCTAAKHLLDWQNNPCGNISKTSSGCPKNHMPPEAARIFDTMNDVFEIGTSFGSSPKLFAKAGKTWPPPFAKRSGDLGKALDFVNGLSNVPGSSDCAKK